MTAVIVFGVYLYIVSLMPAAAVAIELRNGANEYVVAARILFWPLFALKLLLLVLLAGAKDLAA